MPVRDDVESAISASAARLTRAAVRQIERLVRALKREGLDDAAILQRLVETFRAFTLPAHEQAQLREELRKQLERLARSRFTLGERSAAGVLGAADLAVLLAATEITIPKVKVEIRRALQTDVRRVIANGSGVPGLRKALEERGFNNVQTLANTTIAQFNNKLTFEQAAVSGLSRFRYSGPLSIITRKFCRAVLTGKYPGLERPEPVYTEAEIRQMDNGQGLPVDEACGGYNCRHTWIAVD